MYDCETCEKDKAEQCSRKQNKKRTKKTQASFFSGNCTLLVMYSTYTLQGSFNVLAGLGDLLCQTSSGRNDWVLLGFRFVPLASVLFQMAFLHPPILKRSNAHQGLYYRIQPIYSTSTSNFNSKSRSFFYDSISFIIIIITR